MRLEGRPAWSEIRAGPRVGLAFVGQRYRCSWSRAVTGLHARSLGRSRLEALGNYRSGAAHHESGPGGSGRTFLGMGPRPGLLAMSSGQGSQYVGMLRGWRASSRGCRGLVPDERVRRRQPGPLSDQFIHLRPSTMQRYGPGSRFEGDSVRPAGDRCGQPGTVPDLEDFGVRPDLLGGHSFGELTTCTADGSTNLPWRSWLSGAASSWPGARRSRARCSPSSPRSTRSRP